MLTVIYDNNRNGYPCALNKVGDIFKCGIPPFETESSVSLGDASQRKGFSLAGLWSQTLGTVQSIVLRDVIYLHAHKCSEPLIMPKVSKIPHSHRKTDQTRIAIFVTNKQHKNKPISGRKSRPFGGLVGYWRRVALAWYGKASLC